MGRERKEASSVVHVAAGVTATLEPSSVADEAPLSYKASDPRMEAHTHILQELPALWYLLVGFKLSQSIKLPLLVLTFQKICVS